MNFDVVDDGSIVKVKYLNETFVQIDSNNVVARELQERFTFDVPGAKFTPMFKKRLWDGKIRLYNYRYKTLFAGLVDELKRFCIDLSYKFEIDENVNKINQYDVDSFLDGLDIFSRGEKLELRSYQRDAIRFGLSESRAILVSPTASGKSAIIYCLIKYLVEQLGLKGLIIVPKIGLVHQMSSDFVDYSNEIEENTSKWVHTLFSGKDKETDKPLTISTWQSLIRLPEAYFEQYDFVLVDECHLAKATSITNIMTKCVNARFRIGLTGTLDGIPTNKMALQGLFGNVHTVTTYEQMMSRHEIPDVDIKCIILHHSGYKEWRKNYLQKLHKMNKKAPTKGTEKYREEIDYLVNDENRNLFIRNLALSQKNNTMILVDLVDTHAKVLYEMLKNYEKIGDRKVYLLVGEVKAELREQYRAEIEKEHNAIVIGSYGVLSTGVNIRNIHSVIFASPSSKGRVKNLQSLGRGLRKADGKDKTVLYDISDDLRVNEKSKPNFTLEHLQNRIDIYSSEKLNFRLLDIGI